MKIVFRSVLLFFLSAFGVATNACEIEGTRLLEPAKWFTISNTPFDSKQPQDLWVYFTVNGEEAFVPAIAVQGQTNSYSFVVPPILSNAWQDKKIDQFWLTNGESGCQIQGLKHGALKRQLGGYKLLMTLINQEFTSIGAQMGFPKDEILRSLMRKEVKDQNNAVLVFATKVNKAVTEHSRLLQAAQNDPELKHFYEVIDSYIYSTNLIPMFTDAEKINSEFINKPYEPSAKNQTVHQAKLILASGKSNPLYDRGFRETVLTPIEKNWRDPSNAEELAMMMRKQYFATLKNQGSDLTERLESLGIDTEFDKDSLIKQLSYRDYLGVLLGTASVGFASSKTPIGEAGAFVLGSLGTAFFAQAFSDKLVENLYPGKFESISIAPGPYRLYTKNAPKVGSIYKMEVVASAKGVNMAKLMFDLVNNFFPYAKAGGKVISAATKGATKKLGPKLVARIKQLRTMHGQSSKNLRQSGVGVAEVLGKQYLSTKSAAAKDSDFFSSTVIPKFNFRPINILQKGYYQANIDSFDFINWEPRDGNSASIQYSAKKQGYTLLTFRPMPGLWGDNEIVGTKMISVDGLELELTPLKTIILPNEDVTFTISKLVGDVAAKPEFDVNLELSSGFKVADISEPIVNRAEGGNWAQWTVTVVTPNDMSLYPGQLKANLDNKPDSTVKGVIQSAVIEPELSCVERESQTQFSMKDENDQSINFVTWELIGKGELTENGLYTAPSKSSKVTILAKNSKGVVVDQVKFDVGCKCYWRLSVDGERSEGGFVSVTDIAIPMAPTYVVNFIGDANSIPSLTGQGSFLRPKTKSVVVQQGQKSFISGLPVNTNIVGALNKDSSCISPKTKTLLWEKTSANSQWFKAYIKGELTTAEEMASGCIRSVVPYDLEFRVKLNPVEKSNLSKGKTSDEAFSSILGMLTENLDVSACSEDASF